MLAALVGTENFGTVLTGTQMIVFTTVILLYTPCVATIAVLVREFGYRKALAITLFEVGFAIFIGGIISRALTLFPMAP
jgi:ferrous iron transport protein B